ncbi:MAG: hypothetical protein K2Y33_06095 [Mycolicibacterium frederiksbergense]|nr:hypothetical protein [Mycolicibacterium frederiksbergense]
MVGLRRALRATLMLSLAALLTVPGIAHAAAPNWSGLDARYYAGPIPAPGNVIETVPLSPELSVAGAGTAYRILYSTTDQHGAPAVSTAAVFVPRTPAPPGGYPVIGVVTDADTDTMAQIRPGQKVRLLVRVSVR